MYGSPSVAQIASLIVIAVLAFALPLVVQADYYFFIVNLVLTNLVLALGLDLLVGRSGQFAFSHIAFFGIGAYTTALLQSRLGVTFLIGLPIATVFAGLIGVLIAVPATRMRSINLALATFAFAQGVQWIFTAWESLTGGANGLTVQPASILGLTIASDVQAMPWMATITLIAIAAVMYIGTSKLGRSMAAIRESENAAAVSGVNVQKTKVLAFGISAAYAGIAGGMFTLHQSFLDPTRFGFATVVLIFSMIVVGGLGSVAGTVIGAVALTLLPEFMRAFMRDLLVWQEFAYGLILLLCMMFMPRGIWGSLRLLFAAASGK